MARSGRSAGASGDHGLSLVENVVLGLVGEGATHGFAVARLVGPDGPVGQVCRVPRPLVYRALDRLLEDGLIKVVDVQASQQGPQRTRYGITPAGRRELGDWLGRPVPHVRDIRMELLAKLVLLRRVGADIGPLVAAQREKTAPILAGLEEQVAADDSREIATAWRCETARAAMRFLDGLTTAPQIRGSQPGGQEPGKRLESPGGTPVPATE